MQITREILLKNSFLPRLIELALEEDLHDGDSTSKHVLSNVETCHGMSFVRTNFIAKADGLISGLVIMPLILKIATQKKYIKNDIHFNALVADGDKVSKNTIIAEMSGSLQDILCLERTLLNFMSRMSGVATFTNKMVDVLKGEKAKIYDTRKTIPGWRILDKYAVSTGGGTNHRLDLGEYLMIKDNYFEGDLNGVLKYLSKLDAKNKNYKNRKLVEIEIDNFEYFNYQEIWNADIIMLDNMGYDDLQKAIKLIRTNEMIFNRKYEIEISGGLSLEDLAKIKSLDVDRISIGKITHSAPSFDISLDIKL
jgi:nicotinate-nucleotide pyrophosphorylase (carboxylating)